MTQYLYRYIIFVRWDKIHVANNQADAWDIDSGGEFTFGNVRLSPNGQEPATHTACNTAATDEMQTGIFNSSNPPFIDVYGTGDGWTWETALADSGLQVIQSEEV